MNSIVERYKLCLQCVEEYDRENRVYAYGDVISGIKGMIVRKEKRWMNVLFVLRSLSNYKYNLCMHCPYELEHIVLRDKLE